MRSIGAAIVPRAGGLSVPAEHMEFRPIRKLFTRLAHRDMLGRGLSTFEVDALELAHIVSRQTRTQSFSPTRLCHRMRSPMRF